MPELEELMALRGRIRALQCERRALASQVLSRNEMLFRLDEFVDATERQGRNALLANMSRSVAGGSAGLFMARGHVVVGDHPGAAPFSLNLGDMLIALVGSERVKALLREIAADIPEGLEAAERAARLASIDAELDRLETDEETTICALEQDGHSFARRPDARPEIVLRVA